MDINGDCFGNFIEEIVENGWFRKGYLFNYFIIFGVFFFNGIGC